MALGKRKRRDQISDTSEAHNEVFQEGDAGLQALFRQQFEAKFRPLDTVKKPVPEQQLSQPLPPSEESSSDWDGIKDEEDYGPEIVELDPSLTSNDELPPEELKSFMVLVKPQASTQKLTNDVGGEAAICYHYIHGNRKKKPARERAGRSFRRRKSEEGSRATTAAKGVSSTRASVFAISRRQKPTQGIGSASARSGFKVFRLRATQDANGAQERHCRQRC